MDGRPATAAANGSTSIALSLSSASSKDIASETLRNEPTPSPYGKGSVCDTDGRGWSKVDGAFGVSSLRVASRAT